MSNIYPTQASAPVNAEMFNRSKAETYMSNISTLEQKFKKKLKRTKYHKSRLSAVTVALNTGSFVTGASAIGTLVTVIGVPVSLALSTTSAILGGTGVALTSVNKKLSNRQKRYSGIVGLIVKTKMDYEITLSKSYANGIDVEELERLQNIYKNLLNHIGDKSKFPVENLFKDLPQILAVHKANIQT